MSFNRLILLFVITATVISTLDECFSTPILKNQTAFYVKVLKCFSIKKNFSQIINKESIANQIECLYGLKAFSIAFLLMSIKLISIGHIPFTNRNKVTEFFNSPLSIFLRTPFLYEDVFLLISGILATFSLSKGTEVFQKSAIIKKIILKALRIVLPLSIVLLFYAFIWEHLGSGPQWSSLVDVNANLCKENLWKNLLFIQNTGPIENSVRKFIEYFEQIII
jgi:hypothetical protein